MMLLFYTGVGCRGWGDNCWGDKCCAHAGQGVGEAGLECKSLFPCFGAVAIQSVVEEEI